jgi:hypothetical protein
MDKLNFLQLQIILFKPVNQLFTFVKQLFTLVNYAHPGSGRFNDRELKCCFVPSFQL